MSNNFIDSLIELWIMKSLLCIKRNILSWKTVNFHIICVLHFLSLFPVVGRGYGYFQCGTIFIWTYIFVLFVCLRLYFFHFPLFVFCSCFSIQFQCVYILVPFISFRFCLLHFPFRYFGKLLIHLFRFNKKFLRFFVSHSMSHFFSFCHSNINFMIQS